MLHIREKKVSSFICKLARPCRRSWAKSRHASSPREFQTTKWQAAFIILATIVQFFYLFMIATFKNRNSILKMQRLSKSALIQVSHLADALHSDVLNIQINLLD